MLPPKKRTDPQQRQLLDLFARLDADNRVTLLAFAEFLDQRQESRPATEPVAQTPLDIPRPDKESVVAAIRRLAETYPMLNREELLHQASSLMSAHVMHGRAAPQVIDDLQALFATAYENHVAGKS